MAIANELSVNTAATALDMANAIFGNGITVVSATYSGDALGSGTYTGALSTIPGIVPTDSGVILSTGDVTAFTNSSGTTDTNTTTGASTDLVNGIDGDAQLNAVAGMGTFDGSILTADFIPTGDMLTMQFVFSSEEYPEYVNGGVNDAFGVWINGTFVPATISVAGNISIDSVNVGANQNLYVDNTADQYNTEMDGFTYVLSFKAPVNVGQVNTIKIGVADGGDAAYDSNLLIMGNSVQTYALAMDDTIQLTASSSRTFDILANDRDQADGGFTITHLNGTAVIAGQTITLGTGEQVRLNADGTVTVFSDAGLGTNTMNYTILDSQGNTDTGYIFIETVAATGPDGIVQGTSGADTIQTGYVGDPDGDLIDNNDGQGVAGTTGDADYIMAGAGNDSILSNVGNDIIYAGTGDDTAFGGDGADWVSLGEGNDSFGAFNDNDGNDTVYGDAGDDFIIAGGNNDIVYGGTGADGISGGQGDDTLYGGDGADTLYVTDDHAGDTIYGGEGGVDNDQVNFANWLTTDGVNVTATGSEAGTYAYTGTSTGTTGTYSELEAFVGTNYNDTINLSLDGSGTTVYSQAGNDSITGGAGEDLFYGGDGNDTVFGQAGNDTLSGQAGDDSVFGGTGNDTITGEDGNDVLNGGAGNDSITGGSGADLIAIDTGYGLDTVVGGETGLDYDVITSIGVTDAVNIVYTGDQAGTIVAGGASNTVTFSEIEAQVLSLNNDIVDASNDTVGVDISDFGGNDTITGGSGNDTVSAGAGDDSVLGEAGNDSLQTGTGNDYVDAGTGQDTVVAGDGNDSVRGNDGDDLVNGGLGEDTIYGGLGNDVLQADAGNDLVYGDAGNDYLDGGDGNDMLYGGLGDDQLTDGDTGNDQLYGDAGNDMLNSNTGADTLFGGDGEDTLQGYGTEAVTLFGGAGDDQIYGTWAAVGDQISGDAGNDTIYGNAGNETISGGTGNDFLEGGDGSDAIFGNDGADFFSGAGEQDSLYGGGDQDTFTQINTLGGVIFGGETFTTGTDNDTLVLNYADVQSITYGGGNNEAGTVTFTAASGGGTLTFSEIEQINYTGAVDGTSASETMGVGFTDAQGDIIDGADGINDTILGYGGDDTISAGDGADIVFGGADNDSIDAGSGNDTVQAGDGNDIISGSSGDDIVYGDAGNDTMDGNIGTDSVYGGLGDDQINGGDGADILDGGDGNDLFVTAGGPGDTVYGGAGNDIAWIYGGATDQGVDYYGGTGADTIGYGFGTPQSIEVELTGTAEGTYSVNGMTDNTFTSTEAFFLSDVNDTLNGANDTGGILVNARAGDDSVVGGTGADTVYGGDGNDAVYGGLGADMLNGEAGNDSVFGGDGDDHLGGQAGEDTLYGGLGADRIWGDDDADVLFGGAGDTIIGGEGITTGTDNDTLVLNFADVESITYGGGTNEAGTVTFTAASGGGSLTFSEIENIAYIGPVDGTTGDDIMYTGFIDVNGDQIDGADGLNDTIYGYAGNDWIDAGFGDDLVYGGDGNDAILTGAGNDIAYGGAGNDRIETGDDADTIYANQNDAVHGGEGGNDNDTLIVTDVDYVTYAGGNGEAGTIYYNDGSYGTFSGIEHLSVDGVVTDASDGLVSGTAGADVINAGYVGDTDGDMVDANDAVLTGTVANDDVIVGEGGSDTITAGAGNDVVYGDGQQPNEAAPAAALTLDWTAANIDGVNDVTDGTTTVQVTVSTPLNVNSIDFVKGSDSGTGIIESFGSSEPVIVSADFSEAVMNVTFDLLDIDADIDYDDKITIIALDANGNQVPVVFTSLYHHNVVGNTVDASGAETTSVEGFGAADSITVTIAGPIVSLQIIHDNGDTYSDSGSIKVGPIAFSTVTDVMPVTDGDDYIDGSIGDDLIYGGGANDTLIGGAGSDTLLGGADNDALYGASGDVVTGGETGTDNDTLVLNFADVESISYGGGTNEAGTVTFTAASGGGSLSFSEIENIAYAGPVDGAAAGESMGIGFTDAQGDIIDGVDGLDDTIFANAGNDTIDAGEGNDLIFGGAGNDNIVMSANFGNDTIYGGDGYDILDLSGQMTGGYVTVSEVEEIVAANYDMTMGWGSDAILYKGGTANDVVYAGLGNDTLIGGTGEDNLSGGDGDDSINSDSDNDSVYGGAGNDLLTGAAGDDVVEGGDGNDTVQGDTGNDTLTGNAGDDFIWGGDDVDVIYGGAGDSVQGGEGGTDNDTLVLNFADVESIAYAGGNDEAGTVTFTAASGGGTLDFSEIENIAYTGAVDGAATGEVMNPGYTDGQGDIIDGVDGDEDTIFGNGGNDTISSGVGNDLVYGGLGNDVLISASGDDTQYGGVGNDDLQSGSGNDLLDGGEGGELFHTSALSGADTVVGGETGESAMNDVLNIATSTTPVTVNFSGNEAGSASAGTATVAFSEIETIWTDIGNDTINASATTSGVTIWSDGGDDFVTGGSGDDWFTAGMGNDEVFAGAGNDNVMGDSGADQVYGGDGNDTLNGGADNDYIQGDAGNDSVEGGAGDDFLRGDAGNDAVYGGDGNDTVYGGADSDTIYGGAGDDSMFGGFGSDTVYAGTGNDTVTGSGDNDVVYGDEGDDLMQGSSGDDTLYGGDGADTMLGEDDADTFYAGSNDVVDGYENVTTGTDNDTLHVTTIDYIDWDLLNPENGTVYYGDGSSLQFFNIENVFVDGVQVFPPNFVVDGTSGDDLIDGSYVGDLEGDMVDAADNLAGNNDDLILAGAGNDQVYSADGNDSVHGGAGDDGIVSDVGNDTLWGDAGNDTLQSGDGNDLDFGGLGNDTIDAGAGNDSVDGGEDDDIIYGQAGDDTLLGFTGNDTIYAGTGDDEVYGGAGDDTLVGEEGNDSINAGEGDNLIQGNEGNDTITSGSGADDINAGTGNDSVSAGDGNDTVYGFQGDDTLSGDAGNDVLTDDSYGDANDGNNVMYGGGGDDTLNSGGGNDLLYAGSGTNLLNAGAGDDWVMSDAGSDSLYAGAGNDTLSGMQGDDLMYGGAGEDYVYADWGNDTLYGDAGNDYLHDAGGDDRLYGGDDADRFALTMTQDADWGTNVVEGGEGGNDNDTLDASALTTDTTVNFDGDEFGKLASGLGDVTFSEIEAIHLGDGNDLVNAALTTTGVSIMTGQGNDTVYGGTGADTIMDAFGDDQLFGGAGDDVLSAGFGLDTLTGGAGDDVIALNGSVSEVQVIVLADGSGNDTVTWFETPTDNGDGTFTGLDQLDVSGLTDAQGNPVNVNDVTVTADVNGDAVLTFPNGESITLFGVAPAAVNDPAALTAMGIPAETLDFIVEGTTGDDYIDSAYTGDPEGDMIDAADNLASNNDDLVVAGAGNDTVFSGTGNDTVSGEDGNDVLQTGLGADVIYGGTGNDQFYTENGSDTVYGGDGDDSAFASFDGDLVYGGAGNDWLQGGGYAGDVAGDSIYGETGNDTLLGGGGNDLLFGGADNDLFQVVGTIDNDTITGGETGTDFDRVDLSTQSIGVTVGFTGNETGTVTGAGPEQIAFSEVEGFILTSQDDLYEASGTTTGTSVYANAGDDTLQGGSGNDTFFAGADNDSIIGGDGDDSLSGEAGNDYVFAGTGNDIAYGGLGNDTLTLWTGNNIGQGGDGDDWISAEEGNDSLYGGANVDTIFGGAGNDLIYGGTGNDTINAGEGVDTVYGGDDADNIVVQNPMGTNFIYGGEAGTDNDTIDLLNHTGGVWAVYTGNEAGQITDTAAGTTNFAEIEGLVLSMDDDWVDASMTTSGVNLGGFGGNDSMTGGTGADSMTGGDGDDTFYVLDTFGNDTINGNEAGETVGDTLDAFQMTGDAVLDLSAGSNDEDGTLTTGADVLTFSNIENFILGDGNDSVIGSAGNDQVTLGAGQDTVDGGAGNDAFDLGTDGEQDLVQFADGDGNDTLNGFEAPTDNGDGTFTGQDLLDVSGMTDAGGSPVDTDDVTVSDDGFGNAVLTFPNGETITLTGVPVSEVSSPDQLAAMGIPYAPDLVVDGTSGDDTMAAGYVDIHGDQIDGTDGDNDVIMGYGGNDSITGAFGDDTIYGGTDNDTVSGMDGNDSIDGGAGNDSLFGWADNDTVSGGDGNDMVDGDEGNDVLSGNVGDDTLVGDAGNDVLDGGDGVDQIYSGTGNDTLTGGAGADIMYGGDDRDTFIGGIGDVVDGDEGGDDYDVLDLTAYGHPATNIIYDTVNPENGTVEFLDAGGNVVGSMTFSNIENVVACFTPGAQVLTERGEVAVETLVPGDRVLTRDNGFQPIRWAGRRDLSHAELIVEPRFNPVFIAEGALGNGLPERDMMVSPQHRMLITGARAEMLFGEYEVLVAAKHLVGMPGIEQRVSKAVSYIHILFDAHEIVRADGAWSESFQPGAQTLDGLGAEQRTEILALFPELANGGDVFQAARLTLKAKEARVLVRA